MEAGPAIQALIECAMPVAPGSPDYGVRGTEQSDHWHAKCRRHVHGPVVVSHDERSPLQHRCQCQHARSTDQPAPPRLYPLLNMPFVAALLIAAKEDALGGPAG